MFKLLCEFPRANVPTCKDEMQDTFESRDPKAKRRSTQGRATLTNINQQNSSGSHYLMILSLFQSAHLLLQFVCTAGGNTSCCRLYLRYRPMAECKPKSLVTTRKIPLWAWPSLMRLRKESRPSLRRIEKGGGGFTPVVWNITFCGREM